MEKLVKWKNCLNENMVKWKNWLNRKWLNGKMVK